MKLADVNPNTGLVFRPVGRTVEVSTWTFRDEVREEGYQVRKVWHYGTLMGEWYRFTEPVEIDDEDGGYWIDGDETFSFAPLSTGWGSVSDQQGMNRMLAGSGWRYIRKGGARYVHENGRQFPH